MREAFFIKENKDRWLKFEWMLENKRRMSPDKLADEFVQLTDDLSYAKTFYPKSKTAKYLNELAFKAHQTLYRNKKEDEQRFVKFWTHEVTAVFSQNMPKLIYAFAIFAIAVFIGAISTLYDESFVRLILGDQYVDMTLRNIERGDPMAVYKNGGQIDMFLAITLNNIRVAFIAFVLGLAFSVGTAYVLFSNGVMLGAFHTLFYRYGILGKSLMVVYIHGTLEISAIVIAGAAGLALGNSILFPKTYSRKVSFMRGAKDGLKMVMSLVPIFIMAGFLEGFVTRYSNMPIFLNFSILVLSGSLIAFYYIYLPLKYRKQKIKLRESE